MKRAAIVTAAGKTPIYGEFEEPIEREGEEIIALRAAALSNLTRSRASGAHYSSTGSFPAVAGTDGVGFSHCIHAIEERERTVRSNQGCAGRERVPVPRSVPASGSRYVGRRKAQAGDDHDSRHHVFV